MARDEESKLIIPLRDVWKTSRNRRAPRAIREIRKQVSRHAKVGSDRIYLDQDINERVWSRGIQKPPRSIRVHIRRLPEDFAEEAGFDVEVTLAEEA